MKKLLICFLLIVFYFFLVSKEAQAQPVFPPQSCSSDKPYEIVPSCVHCPDAESGKLVLFCYGNKFRLCETDPVIPEPEGNGTWWFSPGQFPNGAVLYNSLTFAVPLGGVFVCDANVFGCNNKGCEEITIVPAPIGYLDQMNITAEKEIDPYQPLKEWYWAECYNPGNGWDVNCLEALNKMGFSSDRSLAYPLWLQEWRNYIVDTVLPRLTPDEKREEIVGHAQELAQSPAQGWVEFVTSGENHQTKRTQISNPRAMLFGAQFVSQLSYATDFIWKSLTSSDNQLKKPILVRDGRDPNLGIESPNNDPVDFGAYWPPPSFFAADKIKGSCVGKTPGSECGTENSCSKSCWRWKQDEFGNWYQDYHYEKDEVWAMRQINPEIETHDNIETLNPGWSELANTWNNIANPINGFIPALASTYQAKIRTDVCDDLFGSADDLKNPKPNLCSWRYANTPFNYIYGSEGKMDTHGCAEFIDPETADESKEERQCYAHWPFVGGLKKVHEFIVQFTSPLVF